MAEQYAPLPESENDVAVLSPETSPSVEDVAIIRIDEYRERLNRRLTLKKMGMRALKLYCSDETLSIVPISVHDHPDGDIKVHYAEYRNGYPNDDQSMSHKGWSGKPESKKVIVVEHDFAHNSINSSILRTRNYRYLESDIRGMQRTTGFATSVREAEIELRKAEIEFAAIKAHLAAATAEHITADAELEAAKARFQSTKTELQIAQQEFDKI